MKKLNKYSLTFLVLAVLLLSSSISCGQTESTSEDSFSTHINEEWEYSIEYPSYWTVETTETSKLDLLLPPGYKGFVSIYIFENPPGPVDSMAQSWMATMAMATPRENITQLENKMMHDKWDWYLSYEFTMTEYGEELFRGEAFFKRTVASLYKIEVVGEKEKYDLYPFDRIVESFTLLTK